MSTGNEFQQSPSGMLYPKEEAEQPRGPLELAIDREEAAQCFTQLLNLSEVRGSFCPSPLVAELRSKMIRHLAEVLLGDDIDFPILT
jgi:hypothetical protein